MVPRRVIFLLQSADPRQTAEEYFLYIDIRLILDILVHDALSSSKYFFLTSEGITKGGYKSDKTQTAVINMVVKRI